MIKLDNVKKAIELNNLLSQINQYIVKAKKLTEELNLLNESLPAPFFYKKKAKLTKQEKLAKILEYSDKIEEMKKEVNLLLRKCYDNVNDQDKNQIIQLEKTIINRLENLSQTIKTMKSIVTVN